MDMPTLAMRATLPPLSMKILKSFVVVKLKKYATFVKFYFIYLFLYNVKPARFKSVYTFLFDDNH
jgi:hypothetical protein